MLKNRVVVSGIAVFSLLIFFSACKTDADVSNGYGVIVRLPSEPENLHPMLTSGSYAVQITSLVLLPAAEFDPLTLELSPLLITEIPKGAEVTEGKHAGGRVYNLQFRPEATWDNGKPVTGEDYLFTIKTAFNPHITGTQWDRFLSFLSEVVINPQDPKNVSVYLDSSYILALETITNFNIYPAHIYDPENVMAGFTLEELRDAEKKWTSEQDSLLKKFAENFESVQFYREVIEGSGPYKFDSWSTGEFIRLKRKENWWGDKVSNPPLLLQAYPDHITYRIITDAATAEAALKAGEIDIIAEVPPSSFMEMKNDAEWKDKFQYATPAILQTYYLELNHRDPVLADKKIRQALAYSIDYDGIMNNLLVGLGQRAVGPILPQRSYYHKELKPLQQDIGKAQSLIKEAGWQDTNGNGIPDKEINGKREELSVNLKITNKEEGQSLAAIVKENAKKAGIEINIEIVDPSQFNQDVRQLNFDIVPLRLRPNSPAVDDPYINYFSTSEGNRSGFQNKEADAAILNIRTAETSQERDSNYMILQEILYEEQPAIYLYLPVERIIVSKKYEIISSSRKPGYFENLFRLAG